MPNEWKTAYELSGVHITSMPKTVQYFERLEQSERRQGKERHAGNWKQNTGKKNVEKHNSGKQISRGKHNKKGFNKSQQPQPRDKQNSDKWCRLHKSSSHSNSECFTQKKNASMGYNNQTSTAKKTKEAKRTCMEERDSDYSFSGDSECKVSSSILREKPAKKPRMRLHFHLSKTLKERVALVDTGCGTSYINADVLAANHELGFKMSSSNLTHEHVEGFVNAVGSMSVKFRFLALNYSTRITHTFAVINDAKDEMVIGRDLLGALGTIVNFRDEIVEWNGNTVAITTGAVPKTSDKQFEEDTMDVLKEINDTAVEPKDMLGEADIDQFTYERIIELLTHFEKLYNGHLGRMKFPDYVLPMAEHYTPVHARPYSTPRSEEGASRKEIQRLIQLDVLEQIFL